MFWIHFPVMASCAILLIPQRTLTLDKWRLSMWPKVRINLTTWPKTRGFAIVCKLGADPKDKDSICGGERDG